MHSSRIDSKHSPGTSALLAAGLLAAIMLPLAAVPVAADLTVADLTDNAVAGVGQFHQDVADAIKKFGSGDYRGALLNLESAKKSTPRLAPPEVMMAQLYFDANQPGQAISMLEQAVRKAPQDPEALVMLGERAVAERRTTEAGLLFEKAAPAVTKFTENPKRRQNLQNRLFSAWSLVDETNQNWQGVQKKLEELLLLEPQNSAAHQRLARVLFHLGNKEQAYEHLKTAAAADPSLPPAEIGMASLFGDRTNSEKWLKHALSRGAKDLRTQLAAAQYYLTNNRIEDAEGPLDEALRLDPHGFETNMMAGLLARLKGDYKRAETYLSAAHLLAPTEWGVTNQLALSLIESPDEKSQKRARQFAELNARQNPDSIECLATLAWINYRLNRRSEAQRMFTTVVNSTANNRDAKMTAEIAYYLAVMSKDAGRNPYAIRVLKEAVNTTQPFAYRKHAQALLTQLEKAEQAQGDKSTGTDSSSKAGARSVSPGADKSGEADPAATP